MAKVNICFGDRDQKSLAIYKQSLSNFYFVKYVVLFADMKIILFGVFVAVFVALPMYLLNVMVMPELSTIKQTYSQAGNIAQQASAYQK